MLHYIETAAPNACIHAVADTSLHHQHGCSRGIPMCCFGSSTTTSKLCLLRYTFHVVLRALQHVQCCAKRVALIRILRARTEQCSNTMLSKACFQRIETTRIHWQPSGLSVKPLYVGTRCVCTALDASIITCEARTDATWTRQNTASTRALHL